jgi:hypothetical protein
VEVEIIRASFINSYLDRALQDPGGSLAARVVREFGRYVSWFHDSLPRHERETITNKLHQLENQISQRQQSLYLAQHPQNHAI